MSDWNLAIELLLAADLSAEESRLGLAIVRETIGYRERRRAIGQHRLREWTGMHGRSFDRAREGLVEKGIVSVERGGRGRGNRDVYEVLLDVEKPALERADAEPLEKPALERAIRSEKPAEKSAETPALERARIEEGGEEDLRTLSERGLRTSTNYEGPPGRDEARRERLVASTERMFEISDELRRRRRGAYDEEVA